MSMTPTFLMRNMPLEFRDQSGRPLPPRVNKAAQNFAYFGFGGAKPTEEDASLLKQHARSISGGGRRIIPRKAKHLDRDAD